VLLKAIMARLISLRDALATAWPIVLVTLFGFAVALHFVEPAPPKKVVMSSGTEAGAYFAYAKVYAELLRRHGIELQVRTSAGAVENLARLKAEDGAVQIAFVQGGVGSVDEAPNLVSLGSAYFEPVWVFYRGDKKLDRLHQLAGKRIAVGADGSGLRGLALQLLEANDIANDGKLLPLSGLSAAEELQQGRIDAAFIIAGQSAPVVQVLLRTPGVRLMSFVQADAYLKRFPFLNKIVLPQGAVDLVRDFPPEETTLLAATANLVVRDDLHPALQSLLLQAVAEVHRPPGFFQAHGEFPAYKDHSFPVSPEAERFYKSGPPFLQRYLPFWAAVLVDRAIVLLLPIVALLIPLLRIAPTIYSWRIRSKIFRCYGDLKFLESELRTRYDPALGGEYRRRLDRIEEEAYQRAVPLAFSDMVYTLREHIDLVRKTLERLEKPGAKEEAKGA
jgi:TRAP transporter TAXI family solute receptor